MPQEHRPIVTSGQSSNIIQIQRKCQRKAPKDRANGKHQKHPSGIGYVPRILDMYPVPDECFSEGGTFNFCLIIMRYDGLRTKRKGQTAMLFRILKKDMIYRKKNISILLINYLTRYLQHQQLLRQYNCSIESPRYTKGWCHFQCILPSSKKLIFKPYVREPNERDYDKQFEKTILEPCNRIISILNYKTLTSSLCYTAALW